MSALTRNRSTDTVPNEIMLKYYLQRATGGAGLIVSEGTLITRQGFAELLIPSHFHSFLAEALNGRPHQASGINSR
jgi:2,4-dienoyl-CoA reductase-like NADH-dependent reductase (Old Yellow Enzyme family)